MSLFFIKSNKQIGNAPGTLDFIGEKKISETTLSIMSYNIENFREEENIADINPEHLPDKHIHWINVYGLHNVEKINQICQKFSVENLTIEDILNTSHVAKYEEFEKYKIFILKSIRYNHTEKKVEIEQISILLFKNAVMCFQEQPGGMYNKLRERIRLSKGKIRKNKSVYLFFSIMDIIVENYINEVSKIGIEIENTGQRIFANNNSNIEQELYNLKTETTHLRMQIFPVKDLVLRMLIFDYSDIQKSIKPFFYDLKILTIFASIFIPLTFIAGVYGMNFDYIPELNYKYSYPVFWLVIILITIVLLLFFKKRKWMLIRTPEAGY